jgi:hypothetical protein
VAAGVSVIDNLDQAWKETAEWLLEEPPELEIGGIGIVNLS